MALPIPAAAAAAAVPPVAPAAPIGAPVAPRVPPITYRELFGDAANGPAPDCAANYLHGYRFQGRGIPPPALLRDQAVTLCDRQPMASSLCMAWGST